MDETLLGYVKKISKNLGNTHTFDIWEKDDIEQEVYLLMLQAVDEYDEKKGDDYMFYFNYIKNRLSNFRRDNYSNNKYKMGISDARSLELDIIDPIDGFIDNYKDIIDDRVDSSMRADYLRYREGVKIPHKRKVAIMAHIKDIIGRANRNEEISHGEC